jgi:hypothetical protein
MEKLILNVTMFVVGVWGRQYREELILNFNALIFWIGEYREEIVLILLCLFEGLGKGI